VPGGGAVHAHRKIIIALARLEYTSVIVSRHVPEATHDVVNVLAVPGSVGADASAETELGVRDEARPFVVLQGVPESVAKDEAANRVAVTVGSMGIELSSLVLLGDVELGEVALASNLHVIGSLDEMYTLESTIGDGPCAAAGLGAPCNLITFGVANGAN